MVYFFAALADLLRNSANTSIDYLTPQLIDGQVLLPKPHSDLVAHSIQRWMFVAIGWITTLYTPSLQSIQDNEPFVVDTKNSMCFQVPTLDSSLSRRSIAEMLRNLGEIMPSRSWEDNHQGHIESSSNVLQVASLNASTLMRVGNIKIEWTDNISCHLEFESAGPLIRIFRFPSFCSMHSTENSVLSQSVTPATESFSDIVSLITPLK